MTEKGDILVTNSDGRLFVDLDGTCAEWRNIELKVKSYEDKEKVLKKLSELLTSPGYFLSLLPYKNVCEAINNLAKTKEVYILSCAIPKDGIPNPESEKRAWIREYLPNIPEDHIIIVPDGEDKTKYIEGGVRKGDVLLDDYSKNLREFEAAGGTPVKLLNDINESKGSFRGNAISKDSSPKEIEDGLRSILSGEMVRHNSPRKDRTPYMELTKDSVILDEDEERDR